jgi:uncharacterized protein (TIRG00374 family)
MTEKKKGNRLFSRSQLFFYLFAILLTILVIYYFADVKRSLKLFKKVDVYWLAAAICGQAFTYLAGALVYFDLLRMFKVKPIPSLWKVMQANIVVLLFNQTVPSAQVSGNTFFLNFLRKRDVALSHALSVIFLDLITFYAGMEVIIVASIGVCFLLHLSPVFFLPLGIGFVIFMLFAASILLVGSKRALNKVYKKLTSIKFIKKLIDKYTDSLADKNALQEMSNPAKLMKEHKITISRAVISQVLLFMADSFTILALYYGLGIEIPILYVVVGLMATKVISILPVSPGALILYESSMTFFFVHLGVPVSTAIVVTLLYRTLSFWLPMPVGFLMYKRLQK